MFGGKNLCTGTGPVASRVASRWIMLRNELLINVKCYASLLLVWSLIVGSKFWTYLFDYSNWSEKHVKVSTHINDTFGALESISQQAQQPSS